MSVEQWRPVVGFEGLYEVSDHGRVRSLAREVVCSGARKGTYVSNKPGRVLRPGRSTAGHFSVALGRGKTRMVHALVLEAFVGPRPQGYDSRHLDGNPRNNQLTNLVWSTRGDNSRDKKWHAGAKTYKLRPPDITSIKSRFGKVLQARLAEEFGVSQSTISAIKHGKIHTDVSSTQN